VYLANRIKESIDQPLLNLAISDLRDLHTSRQSFGPIQICKRNKSPLPLCCQQ
jgi:hypothetical protein